MALEQISAEQLDFEHLASQIWRGAAERTSGEARRLATTSPLAVRVPDSRLLWHPGLRARSRRALAGSLLGELAGAIGRGAVKLLRGGVRFEVARAGRPGNRVLVVPSALGKAGEDGRFRTAYIELDPECECLVFGPPGTAGAGATEIRLGASELLGLAVRLKLAGLASAGAAKGRFGDRMLLLLEWLVWVAALRFAYDLALGRALEARLARGDVSVVASVHEMNSIGRTVWVVAERHGIAGHALQHAEVTSGKRWYFPLPDEIEAGVRLPAQMIVYDSRVAEELAPHLPSTRFRLGCSARYAGWKERRAPASSPDADVALFVGALASFDNDVVIGALERVSAYNPPLRLAVRLHPAAEIPPARAAALARMEAAGAVEVSRTLSLADDLGRARVVVGMSTTVLEEALLLGVPVIQLADAAYLSYIELAGVGGVTQVAHEALDAATIEKAAATSVDSVARGAEEIARRLGLANPVVTHALLLDPETLSLTGAPATT